MSFLMPWPRRRPDPCTFLGRASALVRALARLNNARDRQADRDCRRQPDPLLPLLVRERWCPAKSRN